MFAALAARLTVAGSEPPPAAVPNKSIVVSGL